MRLLHKSKIAAGLTLKTSTLTMDRRLAKWATN
jgi:hypothetical protein